jgi:hypothetical protein
VALIEGNNLAQSSRFRLDSHRFDVSTGDGAAAYEAEGFKAAHAWEC